MRIFLQSIDATRGWLLPQSLRYRGSVLWMLDPVSNLTSEEMVHVSRAFNDRDAYIWHISTGGGRALRIRNHMRAFGEQRFLAKHCVSRRTQEWADEGQQYYSDIAKINEDAWVDALAVLSRSTAGRDSALCFLPRHDDVSIAKAWSRAVIGLEWIWLSERWPGIRGVSINVENAWSSYMDATLEIGGIACVPRRDADSLLRLSFFGSTDAIEQAAAILETEGNKFISEDEMDAALRRCMSIAPA